MRRLGGSRGGGGGRGGRRLGSGLRCGRRGWRRSRGRLDSSASCLKECIVVILTEEDVLVDYGLLGKAAEVA